MYQHIRCQVYNANYQPLQPISCKRALTLILQGKAKSIKDHPVHKVNTSRTTIPLPVRVVLTTYKKTGLVANAPAVLNNNNLFLRDKYECQYCGRHRTELSPSGIKLTRDHVNPKDLGGKDVWENCVTACERCNHKKANKPLSESGLKLRARRLYAPTKFEMWTRKQEQLDKFIDGGEL